MFVDWEGMRSNNWLLGHSNIGPWDRGGASKRLEQSGWEERGTSGECDVLEAKRKVTLENLNCLLAYADILPR